MDNVKVYGIDRFKGVKGMIFGYKMVELLEKGFFCVKNDVYVFKDGIICFDVIDVLIIYFKFKEIGMSVEKLREFGYIYDFEGKFFERDD